MKHLKIITVTVELTVAVAADLVQFLKRVSFSEFRSNAVHDDEKAYRMRDAANKVARSLKDVGYAPR